MEDWKYMIGKAGELAIAGADKIDVLNGISELHYSVVKKSEEVGEKHMDYFLNLLTKENNINLRARFTETVTIEGNEKGTEVNVVEPWW